MKEQANEKGLLWMIISSTKHKIPARVNSPFKISLLNDCENVFCQSVVVLLNPHCVSLSAMIHVYKGDASVTVFETG